MTGGQIYTATPGLQLLSSTEILEDGAESWKNVGNLPYFKGVQGLQGVSLNIEVFMTGRLKKNWLNALLKDMKMILFIMQ